MIAREKSLFCFYMSRYFLHTFCHLASNRVSFWKFAMKGILRKLIMNNLNNEEVGTIKPHIVIKLPSQKLNNFASNVYDTRKDGISYTESTSTFPQIIMSLKVFIVLKWPSWEDDEGGFPETNGEGCTTTPRVSHIKRKWKRIYGWNLRLRKGRTIHSRSQPLLCLIWVFTACISKMSNCLVGRRGMIMILQNRIEH